MSLTFDPLIKLLENDKKPSLAHSNVGIQTPYWFWGADTYQSSAVNKSPAHTEENEQEDATTVIEAAPANPETDILQLIAENPDMNAATFFNLLKSKGFSIGQNVSEVLTQDKQTEADSTSVMPQMVRAEQKVESEILATKGNLDFKFKFTESSAKDNGIGFTVFKGILLQEGLGNLKDQFYYSRDAIETAIPIFEGKKIYADHPTNLDEQLRPERSVKDILGHFENVKIEESSDGRAMLVADVVTLADQPFAWARALMRHAVEYSSKFPDKDFIGLSINASGDAAEVGIDKLIESAPESAKQKLLKAKELGIETVRVVSKIDDAISVDLVTEAGAGGKFLQMIEGDKMGKKKKLFESESEAEKKEVESKEAEMKQEEAAPVAEEPQAEKPHDDEAQDIALIKKILADVLGKEEPSEPEVEAEAETEAEKAPAPEEKPEEAPEKKDPFAEMEAAFGKHHVEFAKTALAHSKEMGMKGEEAGVSAMHAMKHAIHASKKQSEAKQTEACDMKKEECKQAEAEVKQDEKQKESAEIIKLTAENARLKESLLKVELNDHVEKVLRESGLPMRVTKTIKEKIKDMKSKNEIDNAFGLFKEAYVAASGEAQDNMKLFVQPEKIVKTDSSKKLDFSDCKN